MTTNPPLYVQIISPILFIICWILIAFKLRWFPIGRTGGTMLCACATVGLGILSSSQAFAAISLSTLSLLFGSMLMSSFLEREGFFEVVQKLLCAHIDNTHGYGAHQLLARVCLLAGSLSALVTNDTCCVVFTPLLMTLTTRYGLPPTPFLLALATSANIGSAASPVGNPQNMLIASASGLEFSTFLAHLLLATLLGLALNIGFLCLYYHKGLVGKPIVWTEAKIERLHPDDIATAALQHSQSGSRSPSPPNLPTAHSESKGLLLENQTRPEKQGEDQKTSNNDIRVTIHQIDVTSAEKNEAQEEKNVSSVELQSISASDHDSALCDQETSGLLSPDERKELESSARSQINSAIEDQARSHRLLEAAEEVVSSSPPAAIHTSQSTLPSQQLHHSSLNLQEDWARLEYIRRLQLETFYGIEIDDERVAQPLPATAPKLVYTTPLRYTAPTEILASSGSGSTTNGSNNLAVPGGIATASTSLPPAVLLHMQPPDYATLRYPYTPPPPTISAAVASWYTPFVRIHAYVRSVSKLRWFLLILFCTIVSFFIGLSLAWCALGGALAMILVDGVDPDISGVWSLVDWSLLLFFSALFIVVEGFHASGWPEAAWSAVQASMDLHKAGGIALYTILIVVGSNTVSNVPLVLILSPALSKLSDDTRPHAWLLLAFISTLAGNLTLVGSVANLIVAARARKWHELTFGEYFRFGFPTTILLITLGVIIIQAI